MMDRLIRLEKEKKITIPEIFKDFFKSYTTSVPKNLVGTDLWNNKRDYNEDAAALLKEVKVDNFLLDTDFVFMIHQGYIFWYFNADGNPDPTVCAYHEGKLKPDNLGPLSKFIEIHTRD